MTYNEISNNMIYTGKYSVWTFLPKTLLFLFQRLGNIYFLVISLLMLLSPENSPFKSWIIIFQLLFFFCVFWIKEISVEIQKIASDRLVNHRTTLVKRGGSPQITLAQKYVIIYFNKRGTKGGEGDFDKVFWKEIKMGDILYLNCGDTVPADVILLDSSDIIERQAMCFLDTREYDGKLDTTRKKASTLTQVITKNPRKGIFKEYRKILNGKIEYESPNPSAGSFIGYLKLKKDPKIERLTVENLVPRGTKLYQTNWIFGIVVYSGLETKIMLNSDFTRPRRSHFDLALQYFTLFSVIFILILSSVSSIVYVAFSKSSTGKLIERFDPETHKTVRFVWFLILYSPMVPTAVYGTLDFVLLINKLLVPNQNGTKWDSPAVEKKMIPHLENVSDDSNIDDGPKEETRSSPLLQIKDPDPLSNLAHVDFALFDKTGTLTTDLFMIDSICVKEAVYQINQKELEEFSSKPAKSNKEGTCLLINHNDLNQFKNAITNRQRLNGVDLEQEDLGFSRNWNLVDQVSNSVRLSVVGREVLETSGIEMGGFMTPKRGILLGEEEIQRFNISSSKLRMDDSHVVLLQGNEDSAHRFAPQSQEKKAPNTFFEELLNNSNKDLKVFMKTLALCHSAKITPQRRFSSERKEDVTILEFVKKCQYEFSDYTKEEFTELYELRVKLLKQSYEIIGVNSFDHSRGRFSIVLKTNDKEFQSGYAVLLCKGSYHKMRNSMNISPFDSALIEETLKSYGQKGLRGIVYGMRSLSMEQTQEFQKKYQNLKHGLVDDVEARQSLARDVECKLNFVGMVGIRNEIRPQAEATLSFLKELKIKVWLLSGDGPENTLNTAANLKLIGSNNGEVYSFTDDSDDSLIIYTKNILRNFKALIKPHELPRVSLLVSDKERRESFFDEIFQRNQKPKSSFDVSKAAKDYFKNKICVVNGDSLNRIMASLYLRTHFTFIASLTPTLVGYNFTPEHKSFVTSMIKSYFGDSPTVLAVGDGFNDSLMLKDADIGIEVAQKDESGCFASLSGSGDLVISEIEQIKDLLIIIGRKHAERVENVILFMFYSFAGPSINESLIIFSYQFFFSSLLIIIYAVFHDTSNEFVLRKYFALYADGRQKKKKFISRFCLKAEIEAFVHATVIFYFNIYVSESAFNQSGQAIDIDVLSTNQLWMTLLVQSLKVFVATRFSPIVPMSLSVISSVIVVLSYTGIVNYYEFSTTNLLEISFEIGSRPHCIMGYIMIIALCLLFSFCYQEYLLPLFDATLYEIYAKLNQGGHSNFSNKIIASRVQNEISLGSQVKKIFKNVSVMDDLIQEMLNPADIDTNDLKIHSYRLNFMDFNLEKKYQHIRARKSNYMFRSIFLLLVLCYGVYSLCRFLEERDEFFGYSRLTLILLFTAVFVLFQLLDNQNYYQIFMKIFLACLVGIKTISDWFQADLREIGLGSMLVGLISTVNLSVEIIFLTLLNVIHLGLFLARMLVIYNTGTTLVENTEALMKFYIICSSIFLVLMFYVFCVYLNYKFEKLKRNDFLAKAKLEIDRQIREDILSILVPKFVKDYMNQGQRSIQQEQKDVCILFCDICDFDSIMKIEQKKIIEMLDNLFRIYDTLCITHGIQKIETVGKTYMACAGIKACDYLVPEHTLKMEKTRRIVNMAFDMMKEVENVTYNSGQDKIKIKIGIHSGRVIAGVIGLHKPQFSLIGDTVNTTSRVCSTGESGIITISEEVHEKLKGSELTFIKRTVEAKGKGLINTYQVKRDISTQNLPELVHMIIKVNKSKFKKQVKSTPEKNKSKGLMSESAKEVQAKNSHRASSTIKIISNYFANRLSLSGRLSVNFSSKTNKKDKSKQSKFNPKNNQIKEQEESDNEKVKAKDNKEKEVTPGPEGLAEEKNASLNSEAEDENSKAQRGKVPSRGGRKKTTNMQFNFIFEEESKYDNDEDMENDEKITAQVLKPSKIFLTFDKSQLTLVGEFLEDLKNKSEIEIKFIVFIMSVGNVFQMLISLAISIYFNMNALIMVLRGIFSLVLILLVPFVRYFFTGLKTPRYLMILTFTFGILTLGLQNYLLNKKDSALKTALFMEISLLYFVASNLPALNFVESIFISITYFSTCLVSTYLNSTEFNVPFFFFYLTFTLVNILKINNQFKQNISSFNRLQINQSKRIQQESLVSQLLPMHAFEKLRTISITNKLALTDVFNDVTLLYADIAGFTNYSSSVQPEQVVLMIKKLFTEFDKNCLKYRVYKVYTIGDCYVVMGFINASQRNPLEEAKNVVKMGLSMIEVIRQVRSAIDFMGLDMRIGIHTGTVVGGIIGTDIVRYDIYGKDVLIANKMESNGQIGAIMVSETTKALLEKDRVGCKYRFEKKTDVEIKSEDKTISGYLLYKEIE